MNLKIVNIWEKSNILFSNYNFDMIRNKAIKENLNKPITMFKLSRR